MQSQQKRVKWSRGETAEALEERTDTGITQASVELMENCIPDIYGNVSRRPALKTLGIHSFTGDKYLQVFPFYITEDDFILVGVHFDSVTELIRVKNGMTVHSTVVRIPSSAAVYPRTRVNVAPSSSVASYKYRPVSYAQQNNYMLIADAYAVYKLQISNFDNSDDSFTPSLELLKYSAGWYAPNGTTTGQLSNMDIPGLNFHGGFSNYTYNDISGTTTVYSQINTGLSGEADKAKIEEAIPVGTIIQLPNIGCYFRVEGYYINSDYLYFDDITFDSVGTMWVTDTPPATGHVCMAVSGQNSYGGGSLRNYYNGTLISSTGQLPASPIYVKSSASSTGYYATSWYGNHHDCIFTGWYEIDASQLANQTVMAYGSLLTPAANENAADTYVALEMGYINLSPENYTYPENGIYPHPTKLLFNQQRLWAGGWASEQNAQYSIVLGSQIARYNDFKNDYNQENEPITLDILTQFKEKIVHLVDYNGLKIMTKSYEYAYNSTDGAVKQSSNGSLETCEPLVFESLCVYADATGNQIKAMQYEFQSNIFNSSSMNQLAPHDLIWFPISMAAYEDKIYSTGKYLFVVNEETDNNPRLAVCNFVPANQANIWSRWSFPQVQYAFSPVVGYENLLYSVVKTKNQPIFLVNFLSVFGITSVSSVVPAVLDFDGIADFISPLYTLGTTNYFAPEHRTIGGINRITLANQEVSIYSNGVFQFTTTTNANGAITADLSGLENITVGLPINATVRSHPIDVGGKTKSIKKRIGKTVMSVHNTEAGAITINGKTGYMNSQGDKISFYGVTGMKDEIRYTITNKNGAMFHLESLLMNIEYGTLDS